MKINAHELHHQIEFPPSSSHLPTGESNVGIRMDQPPPAQRTFVVIHQPLDQTSPVKDVIASHVIVGGGGGGWRGKRRITTVLGPGDLVPGRELIEADGAFHLVPYYRRRRRGATVTADVDPGRPRFRRARRRRRRRRFPAPPRAADVAAAALAPKRRRQAAP